MQITQVYHYHKVQTNILIMIKIIEIYLCYDNMPAIYLPFIICFNIFYLYWNILLICIPEEYILCRSEYINNMYPRGIHIGRNFTKLLSIRIKFAFNI